MKTILSLDIGNKQSKLKSELDTYILPSALVNKRNVQSIFSLDKPVGTKEVKLNGDSNAYYWGGGVLNFDKNKLMESLGFEGRYERTIYRLLNEFALAILGKDFEDKEKLLDVHVVAGLPTGDYNRESIEAIKSIFLEKAKDGFKPKSHLITIDDEEVIVKVTEVTTLPQPIGTFYNTIINEYGDIVEPGLVEKRIGIVDIGGGTALLDQLQNANLDANYRTQLETGANTLYQQVRNSLMQEYGLNADLRKIEFSIRSALEKNDLANATFVYKQSDNNSFDITEIVYSEIQNYTESLANNIFTTFQNLAEIDALIVTGGTANIIDKDIFQNYFGKSTHVIFTEKSETANVNGFYKYALLHQG